MVGRKRRTTAKGPAAGKKAKASETEIVNKKGVVLDDVIRRLRGRIPINVTPNHRDQANGDSNLERETLVRQDKVMVPHLRMRLKRTAGGTSYELLTSQSSARNSNNHEDEDNEDTNNLAMEIQQDGNTQLSEGWTEVIRKTGGREHNKDPTHGRQRRTAGGTSKKNGDQPSTKRRRRAESSAHTEVSVSDIVDVDSEITERPDMDTQEDRASPDLSPSRMSERSPHEQHLADHDEDMQEEESNRLGRSPSLLPPLSASPRRHATDPSDHLTPEDRDDPCTEGAADHVRQSFQFSSPLSTEDQMLFVNCLKGDAFLQIPQDVSGRNIEDAEFCPLCFSSVQSSRQHIVSVHLREEVDKKAAKEVARYLIHWAQKNRVASSTTMLKSEILNRCRAWEDVSSLVERLEEKGMKFVPVDNLRGVIFEGTGLPKWDSIDMRRDFGVVAGRRLNPILRNDRLDKKKFTENAWRELTKREIQQELMNVVPVKSLCQNRTEEVFRAAERHLLLKEHPFLQEISDLVKTTCQTAEEEEEHEANVASFLSVVLNGMRTCHRFRLIHSEEDFDLAEMTLGLRWLAEAFKFNGQTERRIDFFRRVYVFASSFGRVTDRLIWRSQMIELMQACAPYYGAEEEEDGGEQRSPAASGSGSAQQQD